MSTLDWSGTDRFFEVADTLKHGTEPDQGAWDRLFATPGYRALTAGEFPAGFLKRVWLRALSPREAAGADPPGPGEERMVEHAREVMGRRDELMLFRENLDGRADDLLLSAKRRATEFLPPGEYDDWSDVALVVFDRDARGYIPVVVDILYALRMESDHGLVPLIAHEYHHQQVLRLRGIRTMGGPDRRSDLHWILDQIHLEGTANMINIPSMAAGSARDEFMAHVRDAPAFLRLLDRGLIEASRDPSRADAVGRGLRRDIVWSGHPVGYYVAMVIAGVLGTGAVAMTAADPVLFLKRFRQAALQSAQEPPLTEDAVVAAEKMFYSQ